MIYADFESFIQKISGCSPDERRSFTNPYQLHKPSGYAYVIKCFDDGIFEPRLVSHTAESPDDEVEQHFMDSLEEDIKNVANKFLFPKKILMTRKNIKNFKRATHCHICERELGNNENKVKDHCHLTGKYRGAAHESCNLNFKIPKFFPVIFHNLSRYDAHLFVKHLGASKGKINCIPNNEERYISFSKDVVVKTFEKNGRVIDIKRQIRFMDSFRFMQAGLGNLVKNLPEDAFDMMEHFFDDEDDLKLLLRKGVFPYDWFDGFSKLNALKIPPKEEFYSALYDSHVSDEDYAHAQNVWDNFKMRSMRDYHDLYLKTDTILLADLFENFRDVCIKNYGLDPAWYYTSPGLA